MIAIQKSGEARVCRYGCAAVFVRARHRHHVVNWDFTVYI